MKKIVTYIALFCCVLTLSATPYTVESVPALDNTTRVANPDGVLSSSAIDSINSILLDLDKHQIQALVVVVRNIEGDDPYSFAIGLGRRFGVGGSKSQGIVVVLATDDRSYQIVTGNGMEAYLPDAICKRIENRAMLPYLKQGNWDQAMVATIRMMRDYIEQEPELMEQFRAEDEEDEVAFMILSLFLIGAIVFFFALIFYHDYQQRRCPNCGQHKLKQIASNTKKQNGKLHIYRTYRCSHCKHQLVRDQIYNAAARAGSGGIFIGSGGGYGGHSGGFGGGGFSGFGGGSFGGGGAGGRF